MSHTNRNFIIAYTLLVAVPIFGLMGVLKSGRGLNAPVSIDGMWQIQADPIRMASLPCGKAFAQNPQTALAISQSGRNFLANFAGGAKTSASGVIDGTTLKASFAPATGWSDEPACSADRTLDLTASVNAKAEPRSFSGVLSVSDCASCGSVEIHAFRVATPEKKATR